MAPNAPQSYQEALDAAPEARGYESLEESLDPSGFLWGEDLDDDGEPILAGDARA